MNIPAAAVNSGTSALEIILRALNIEGSYLCGSEGTRLTKQKQKCKSIKLFVGDEAKIELSA